MKALAKWTGSFAVVAVTTFLSGYAALVGAQAGGLREGGWNWQFLPPLFYGWLGGFIVSLICLAVAASRTTDYFLRLTITFLTPLVLTFGISVAAYSIALLPERRAQQEYRQTLTDLKAQPGALHSLIGQARVRPLSSAERGALWQMLWVPQPLSADEVSFLLDYFSQDGSALGGIMVHQPITPEQLRSLYKRHKNPREYSRVLDELATHPLTPPDVLQALSDGPDRHLAAKVHERLSKK